MSSFLQDITFLRPLWLVLVVFIFIIPKLIRTARKRNNNWLNACELHLLNHQIAKRTKNDLMLTFLCMLLWLSLVLSLAGFSYEKNNWQQIGSNPPFVIALDLSSSMDITDENPSRLIKAWFKLNDILENLDNREKSLVVFSDEPYAVTPLTDDKEIIKNFLPLLKTSIMPSQGKRIDRTIEFSCDLIKQSYYSFGNIILLTDKLDSFEQETLEAAKKSYKNGCITSVLAFGEENQTILKELAKQGGGRYIKSKDDNTDIEHLLKPHKNKFFFQSIGDFIDTENNINKDNGYIFIPLMLLILLPFFRKGFINSIILFSIILGSKNAYAFDWKSLFLSDEQQGAKFIDNNEPEKSLEILENPLWRGGAFYRQQNYESAVKEYSKNDNEMSLYNLGNSLAWSQQFEEAIEAYDKVIEINPNNEDAVFNRDIINKLLENPPPPPPPQEGSGGSGNQSGNGGSGGQGQGDGDSNNSGGDSSNSGDNGSGGQSNSEGNGGNSGQGDNGQGGAGNGGGNSDNLGGGGNNSSNNSSGSNGDNGNGGNSNSDNSNGNNNSDNQNSGQGGSQDNNNGQGGKSSGGSEGNNNQGQGSGNNQNNTGGGSDRENSGNGGDEKNPSQQPPSEDDQNTNNLMNRIPDDPEALLKHKLEMIHSLKRYENE